MRYELLRNPGERNGLKNAVARVVQFAKQNDVKVVVAVESAGRPAAFLFEKAWKAMHPGETPPEIFFFDPYQVPSRTLLSPAVLGHPVFTRASANPGHHVLVLDDTSQSGKTLGKMKRILKTAFKTVYTASLWSLGNKPKRQDVAGVELKKWSQTGSPWQKKGSWIGVRRISNVLFESETEESAKLKKELEMLASQLGKTKRS
ncbi:hypothetical protein J4220_00550 [Candidatus Micrarchaeota archaeon]|nr:hypothetical protein [Candidatus Micrarchaeota archaeon]